MRWDRGIFNGSIILQAQVWNTMAQFWYRLIYVRTSVMSVIFVEGLVGIHWQV